MTPEEVAQMQAEKLGGGWRMERGIVPVIILNTEEAAKLIGQLNQSPYAIEVEQEGKVGQLIREPYAIEVEYEGKSLYFLWQNVTRIY